MSLSEYEVILYLGLATISVIIAGIVHVKTKIRVCYRCGERIHPKYGRVNLSGKYAHWDCFMKEGITSDQR